MTDERRQDGREEMRDGGRKGGRDTHARTLKFPVSTFGIICKF